MTTGMAFDSRQVLECDDWRGFDGRQVMECDDWHGV